LLPAQILSAAKRMISQVAMSSGANNFADSRQSNRHKRWMAEFCPKSWTVVIPSEQPETENRSYKTFPIGNVAAMASNLARRSTIYLDEGNGAFVAIEPAANESQRNR